MEEYIKPKLSIGQAKVLVALLDEKIDYGQTSAQLMEEAGCHEQADKMMDQAEYFEKLACKLETEIIKIIG